MFVISEENERKLLFDVSFALLERSAERSMAIPRTGSLAHFLSCLSGDLYFGKLWEIIVKNMFSCSCCYDVTVVVVPLHANVGRTAVRFPAMLLEMI